MAAIRNSISLQDNMSPVFRSIITAMNSTLNVMQKIDAQSARGAQSKAYRAAERDIKRANTELQRMQNALKAVDKGASRTATSFRTMGSAVGGVSFNLINFSAALYMIRLISGAIGGMAKQADQAMASMAQLGMFGTSPNTNFQNYAEIYRMANETRSPVAETADLVNRLLVSNVFSGNNTVGQATGLARIINQAYIAGGRTAEENQRSLRQLMQGLSSGVFQGDELRSVREQTAYIADLIARGIGKIDSQYAGIDGGDLKALGAAGELTAQRVIDAFVAMQEEIQKNFEAMPKTFGQATIVMGNIWTMFLTTLAQDGGPLARINALLWEMASFFQSNDGQKFFSGIASAMNLVVDALTILWRGFSRLVTFLVDNGSIIQILFGVLIVNAIGKVINSVWTLMKLFASSFIFRWAMIAIGALYLVSEAMNGVNDTNNTIIGNIAGAFMWVRQVIINAFNSAAKHIQGFQMGLMTGMLTIIGWIGDAFFGLVGIVELALDIVVAVLMSAAAIIQYGWSGLTFFFSELWAGIVSLVGDAANAILNIVANIAGAIDGVFGSNFEGGVRTFQTKVDTMFTNKVTEMHNNNVDKMTGAFDTLNARLDEARATITDNWGLSKFGSASSFMSGLINDPANSASNLSIADANRMMREDTYTSPSDAFLQGANWGNHIFGGTWDMSSLTGGASVLEHMWNQGVTVNDGNLDSIGSIKNDVNLKEEDIKMLRDVSAREYLLQMQSVTPTANITFGDVRETADVYRILDVIEDMLENNLASSLVTVGGDGYITE